MKKLNLLILVMCFCFLGAQATAQENFTEGSVWRVNLIDIAPGKATEFWKDVRQNIKPVLEEYKKQGILLSYTIHLKSTTDEPGDWDVAIMGEYKNFAALDGLGAKTDPIALKIYGSVEARAEAQAKRIELGKIVASFLTRQVTLKDLSR